jgi:hypothetical protein
MILNIIIIAAIIGATMAFLFGDRTKESAATGAASGIFITLSFLLQLFLFGLLSIAGIWLVTRIL